MTSPPPGATTPAGIASAHQTDPAKFNHPQHRKPPIGVWIGYICLTVIISVILSPFLSCFTGYLKTDNYKATKALVTYYNLKCDNFPLGLSIGLLLSPAWLGLKKLWDKITK
jgi:hypothetical protein